ncbi:hypothetical protein HDEF_1096 [Candidatus Hamiltonella defensa 5AT (Acyrthosiphon pisum)]|uniref:Uncharacterized protein n=1 Tax=Hamiltonella defensa subsp. Acyrthosiphon pisum (strain 5AT) TaxID=572265 RepID=C4K5C7_HAMD5|nr:hypothetical protein HDEF_1096 [Candidatus Hamiltonella defensa 5AT (Acyrthosiphon pisum)]
MGVVSSKNYLRVWRRLPDAFIRLLITISPHSVKKSPSRMTSGH